jgi:MSHA biogenesis protein MshG
MFPKVLEQVISVGEETGSLEDLLSEIGDHYQSEVAYALSKLSARIEPILIVMLGVLVLILALGVFLPMWEMSRASMGGR